MPKELAVVVKALQFNKTLFTFTLIFLINQNSYSQSNSYTYSKNKDIALFTSSSIIFGTSFYLQKKVKPLKETQILSLKQSDVNAFDRIACSLYSKKIAHISDGLAISSLLFNGYFLFNKNTKKDFLNIEMVSIQSLMLSQAIANGFKLTLRNRPFMYNQNVEMNEKIKSESRLSFFSAHTSTVSSLAFSFAFAHQQYFKTHKANPYIMSGAILLPALQGYLRVRAGKHFPTDVITGHLIGLGSSYLMHRIHRN